MNPTAPGSAPAAPPASPPGSAGAALALPPGSTGLPLLGETLGFLRDPYAFVAERAAKHGPVFRTRILGKDTAVIVGGESAAAFIDGSRVKREGSQPDNVFRLFAGPSLPHLDGDAHVERKAIVLAAFGREALAGYLPAIQARLERSLSQWASEDEIGWLDRLKRLAVDAVAADIMGVVDPAALDQLTADYALAGAAFTSLPIALPGTSYSRGLAAVDRILAFFDTVIAGHRARAGGAGGAGGASGTAGPDDGLSRILATKTPAGTTITDDQVKRELHHLVIAGRVVYAHLVGLILQLAANPEVRDRAREEVMRVTPAGPLTLEALASMPYLSRVLMEVKRTTPVVPAMFAIATADLELHGHRIPKGWSLMFGLHETHLRADVYAEPRRFDPARFAPGRAEHEKQPYAFCPHGPGAPRTSHHCAGTDYATEMAMAFATLLLRGYTWELPPQDLSYDYANLTPDPKDGLRARVRAAGAR